MLAKSVNDAGWSAFIAKLTYKAEEAGSLLVQGRPSRYEPDMSLWRSRPQDTEPALASVYRLRIVCGSRSCLCSIILGLGLSLLGLT